RSPQRNVVDWAFSLLNLGLLHSRSEAAADHARARECYQQALAHLQPADDLILWATLQNNLADVLLAADSLDLDAAESAARSALADVAASQLVAFSVLYDAQTTAEGQRNMLAYGGPGFVRWAAYALARTGRWAEAVEAMEHGRTRQLSVAVGRDTADLARLGAV